MTLNLLSTFRILLFFIGIAGSAAAAEDEPDVEMPAVEWLVAPIKNIKTILNIYSPR